MPSVSEKQAIAMRIAAAGKSNIGIPKAVGKEFVAADKRANKYEDDGDMESYAGFTVPGLGKINSDGRLVK